MKMSSKPEAAKTSASEVLASDSPTAPARSWRRPTSRTLCVWASGRRRTPAARASSAMRATLRSSTSRSTRTAGVGTSASALMGRVHPKPRPAARRARAARPRRTPCYASSMDWWQPRKSWRTLGESARATLRAPVASAADLGLRIALFLGLFGGAVVLGWTSKEAWGVHRLTRGVGNTVFYGGDGRPWFPLDEHRRDVPLDEVAPALRQAVIAVEDHRFYRHGGIDPIGLGRAVWRNLRQRSMAEGGSTITQQLARTVFLTNQRTLGRKVKEALLAEMLEQQLSKDRILELYLNRVALSGGTFGVEAMSRQLFAKRARDLGLAEAALLAGLIRAPSALSPWSNIDGALRRSDVVLQRMREEGFITPAEEEAARRARLRTTSSAGLADAHSGYAKEYLRQLFREQVGEDDPPDWDVHTTFLPAVQAAAERAVDEGVARLGRPGLQAALVALDPRTGNVLAMVGGRNFTASPYNRAVRSKRQPGSAFKPFVYAAALERGMSPVSVITDLHS